ncbi:MAG: MATE family efflux transporter [Lachnospiraceae bacterium]
MRKDLTKGNVTTTMLLFAAPMIAGNLLQQFYNFADTWIVGRFIGPDALASVGSAYTLMTFLTSILIGMCMGSGSVLSFWFGKKEEERMQESMRASFFLIGTITIVLNVFVLLFTKQILHLLNIPDELMQMMQTYVSIVLCGLFFVFLYNYFAYLLLAVGNSVVPVKFLAAASLLNVGLDYLLVVIIPYGIAGAAFATVFSQAIAGIGIAVYTYWKEPMLRLRVVKHRLTKGVYAEILRFSFAASAQQSVMNFGILLVQGLVNSFGSSVMAAFAAGVKIDTLAYMPAQEFGNTFSLFVSQNHGAGDHERIKKGIKSAVTVAMSFCIVVSGIVFCFARYLMMIFVNPQESEIINIGAGYLRVEGAFYCGIGLLFLLYALYRGIGKPETALLLTVISLGTRVILAYILSSFEQIGVVGIWWAIPIGWLLADITGIVKWKKHGW